MKILNLNKKSIICKKNINRKLQKYKLYQELIQIQKNYLLNQVLKNYKNIKFKKMQCKKQKLFKIWLEKMKK